jgi:hypothetical protein
MSDLSNQKIYQSFNGLLQVPGGLTSSQKQVQDGHGASLPMTASTEAIKFTTGLVNTVWTNATKPAAPYQGQQGYNTDTGLAELWNGSAWIAGNVNTSASSVAYTYPTTGELTNVQTAINRLPEPLTSNRTYYVRTDGSDSNNGLTNSSAGAFATIQHAVNAAYNLDYNGYNVTIQVESGTYTAGATFSGPILGPGTLYLIGDVITPTSCVISTTSANCINVNTNATLLISGFTLRTTTSGDCVNSNTGGIVSINAVNFGSCAGNHVDCGTGATITLTTNYTISGGAGGHLHCGAFGLISCAASVITVSNTPNFSNYFIGVAQGTVTYNASTTGTAITGPQYLAHNGGLIVTSLAYATLPGSITGSANSGGYIVGNTSGQINFAPDVYTGNSLAIQSKNFNANTWNNHFVTANDLFQGTGNFYCNGTDSYSSGRTNFCVATPTDVTTGTTDGATFSTPGYVNLQMSNNGLAALSLRRRGSDGVTAMFYRNTTNVGSISVTTTATAYNTSSDYRLKTVESALASSGAFIDALKPYQGIWNVDGSAFVGFLAHEVQEISPKSVLGKKDEIDEDGNPIYQSMDYGSAEIIANIVAELQSLRERLAILEAK